MAAALTLAGVGTASAHDKGGQGHCGPVQLKFSTDGGNSWTTNDTIGAAPSSIKVKLTGDATKGCEYPVSLGAYKTDGPSWETSGTQVFLGVDQATLSSKTRQATLQVKGIDKSTCFGQIDLYGNNKVYDGKSGALPHYPDSYTPTDLIAHWNGSFDKCDQGGSTPPSTPPATPPTTPPASTTPSPSDSTSPSTSPSDSTSPSASTPASATPSTAPSSSAPAVADTAAPSGTPVAQPVSSTPTLAETGSNSSQTTTFVAAGAALVVIGAAAVVFTRRRNRTQA